MKALKKMNKIHKEIIKNKNYKKINLKFKQLKLKNKIKN